MLKNTIVAIGLVLVCVVFSGCSHPMKSELRQSYTNINLDQTGTSEVLTLLNDPNIEKSGIMSQSDTVVAKYHEKKKGRQMWMTAAAFNEENAVAVRKYFYWDNEKANTWLFVHPKWAARFDAQIVLDKAVMEKPYANENARMVAILKYVQAKFREDMNKLSTDNKMLGICRDVAAESMNSALIVLNDSPAYAVKMSGDPGLKFEHKSFYYGSIHLTEANGVATMIIKTGAFSRDREAEQKQPEKIDVEKTEVAADANA